jgi:hypothetical protein
MANTVIGWAHVEIMGRREHFGLVSEVERFGAKMALVQVPSIANPGALADEFTYSASAIFCVSAMTEEAVRERLQAEYDWAHPALPAHDTLRPSDGDEDHSDDVDDEDVQVVRAETLEAGPVEF